MKIWVSYVKCKKYEDRWLIERRPTLDKNKYYDMFMIKNAKKILKESLENIDIYYLSHIYIYLYSIISKYNYDTLIDNIYKMLILYKNNSKSKVIKGILYLYIDDLKDDESLSKLYLFILLSQTTDNKDDLTKYFEDAILNSLLDV